MPKERKLPRGGVSLHVRQTELSNPFARLQSRFPQHEKAVICKPIVTVLGPKARREEIKEADERLKQHLLSMPFTHQCFRVMTNLLLF